MCLKKVYIFFLEGFKAHRVFITYKTLKDVFYGDTGRCYIIQLNLDFVESQVNFSVKSSSEHILQIMNCQVFSIG